MKKQALLFGGLAGGIIILYSTITLFIFREFTLENYSKLEMLGFLRYIIMLLAVFMTIRGYYRSNPPQLNYGRMFQAGLFVSLFIAIFVGIFEAIYVIINPDFMSKYGALMLEMMRKKGASAQDLAQMAAEMKSYTFMSSPWGMGIFYFFETFIVCCLASLLFAAFFRKPRTTAHA